MIVMTMIVIRDHGHNDQVDNDDFDEDDHNDDHEHDNNDNDHDHDGSLSGSEMGDSYKQDTKLAFIVKVR